MAPKFKGDSDDFLDDPDGRSGRAPLSRRKKPPEARSLGLSLSEANAVVAEVFPNQCRVKMESQVAGPSIDLLCHYRRAEVVAKVTPQGEVRERSPVAVGDRVLVKSTGGSSGVIEGICARKNSLARPAPGRDGLKIHHVIAANVDLLVVVASSFEPDFSSGLVDRFLVAAQGEGIETLICITKIDLWKSSAVESPWGIYQKLGYPIFEVSSKAEVGLDLLRPHLVGKSVVFCGHSGVGKTSMLRKLLQSDVGRVGAVNEQTGKGRHTTTGALLLGGPKNSQWIDTPGIKSFGLAKIAPESLSKNFPELNGLNCLHAGCLHLDEEGCLARSHARYPSYRRILESLMAGEN